MRAIHWFTTTEIKTIVAMRENGATFAQIGVHLGLNKDQVGSAYYRNGGRADRPHHYGWSREQDMSVAAMWAAGLKTAQIARLHGRSTWNVRDRIAVLKCKPRRSPRARLGHMAFSPDQASASTGQSA